MSSPLRIGEAALRLGVTADTIREWVRRGHISASRTPTGQLYFDTEEVDALRRVDGKATASPPPLASRPPKTDERPLIPSWKDLPPWQSEVETMRAALTTDELQSERERRADSRERERRLREAEEQNCARKESERQRIEKQKRRVFQMIYIETEHRAAVAAEIEKFATPERVPAWLSDAEQYELIATHARSVATRLRAEARELTEEAQRAIRERQCAETERVTDQMRALLEPAVATPRSSAKPPGSVAEALRRRREDP